MELSSLEKLRDRPPPTGRDIIHSVNRQANMQPNYQGERWQRRDWRKLTRHYFCELRQNLFGNWVVLRRWGRVNAHKGQSIERPCRSYEEGLETLNQIARRRSQRGYSIV